MTTQSSKHTLNIEDRKLLSLTGITKVLSSDDKQIILDSVSGRLKILGSSLSIGKLNVDTGELSLLGHINLLEYKDIKNKGDFFSSLFK